MSSVAAEPDAAFNAIVPATLIEPEFKARVALLLLPPEIWPLTETLVEIVNVVMVEVKVAVAFPVGMVLPPTVNDPHVTAPAPEMVATVFPAEAF